MLSERTQLNQQQIFLATDMPSTAKEKKQHYTETSTGQLAGYN